MKQTSEIVESVVQYASVWKLLVNELPNADLADRPGLSISWADNPFPFWNAVFLTEQLADPDLLESRLKEAAAYVRKKRHSGLIYVCEDYLTGTAKENLPAILEQERLEAAIPITGMAGNVLPLQTLSRPPLLGYENGRAVSTASAIVTEEYLYLALVATRPDARNKGYAEAVVRHALQTAHEATGLKRTILHATGAGFPVYKRVGYHPTARLMTYKPSENSKKVAN